MTKPEQGVHVSQIKFGGAPSRVPKGWTVEILADQSAMILTNPDNVPAVIYNQFTGNQNIIFDFIKQAMNL